MFSRFTQLTIKQSSSIRLFSRKAAPNSVKIDRSALKSFTMNPPSDLKDKNSTDLTNYTPPSHKEPMTPLGKELFSYIKLRGPITLHEYMTQAINHSKLGYYHNKTEKIGEQGDFITSPELGQLFGEMVGLWSYMNWLKLGSPDKVRLVELGPGKGTLMSDILKVAKKFPKFYNAISVNLVELSQDLRNKQLDLLKSGQANSEITHEDIEDNKEYTIRDGIKLTYFSYLNSIQDNKIPLIIIGQEFLDTFPCHSFQYTENGWREKLIDLDLDSDSPYNFQYVLSPNPTPASKTLLYTERSSESVSTKEALKNLNASIGNLNDNIKNINSTFKLNSEGVLEEVKHKKQPLIGKDGLINASHSLDFSIETTSNPVNTEEKKKLQNSLDEYYKNKKEDEVISVEISPLMLSLMEDVGRKIMNNKGVGLFVDYGEDFTLDDTVRGFKNHKQVSILSEVILIIFFLSFVFHNALLKIFQFII